MTLVQRLVILVVIAMLPVLAGVAYSLAQLQDVRTREMRGDAERLVTLVNAQHRRLHETVTQLLTALAIEAPRVTTQSAACATLLARLAKPDYRWLDVLVLDGAGIVRCSTLAGTTGADRSTVPEVAAATDDAPIFGTLELRAFQEEASLQAALAWTGPDDTRGTVLASIRPRPFLAPLIAETLPPEAAVIIADRTGHILYTVPEAPPNTRATLPPSLIATLRRNNPDDVRAAWLDGSDRVVAAGFVRAPAATGIVVLAGIPSEAAFADLAQLTRASGWALGLTLLATMALAYWGGEHYIRRPLGVLTRAALRWRDGDQTARARLPGSSEIAALGRVFDEMADATQQGERQIREAADLLNGLIESSADAIFVKDREGRYVLANSAFARFIGKDRETIGGQTDADLLDPELSERGREIHARVLRTGERHVSDLTMIAPGADAGDPDSQRVLQTIYAPIRADGGDIVAVAAISRDVTDERRAAAELRAEKERAEAADDSKTRFLAAASHDLRQPVQAAVLFASLIAEHSSDKVRRQAEQLRLVLDDLRVMLDSLFDVSRYDTQSTRPEITAFPLQPLIDQTLAIITDAARAKGLAIHVRATPLWVRSDHALLSRMLGNIMQNAVRYTEFGSITVSSLAHEGRLRIEVRDTGPGIAAGDLARIWQEFEQLHNPERDRRQGLGLGLAIVRRLSRILDHPVNVTSAPGFGTCFTIDLPLVADAPTDSMPGHQAHAPPDTGLEHVAVVVEDDPPLLSVLSMILEDHGWSVIGAADTEEALAQLESAPSKPDVILTDYRLRDGQLGTGAITAIRGQVGRKLPAIILTGDIGGSESGTDGPVASAEKLGGVAVLRKPVAAAELAAALNRAVTVAEA